MGGSIGELTDVISGLTVASFDPCAAGVKRAVITCILLLKSHAGSKYTGEARETWKSLVT